MRKNKRNKGGFFSLMIKNYLIFTVINVIIAMSIIAIANNVMERVEPKDNISSERNNLKAGKFTNINKDRIVGSRGYFEVLDNENKIIYTSDEKRTTTNQYTIDEMNSINAYNPDVFIETKTYHEKNGSERILITKARYNEDEDVSIEESYLLLDQSLRIISASPDLQRAELSQKEFEYLSDNHSKGYSVRKYQYAGNDGKNYTLILHTGIIKDSMYRNYFNYICALFIFCYILCIIGFVLWLSKKVRKPLTILSDAMTQFTDGYPAEEIQYTGTDEFVQICDNFNRMAERLKISEQEKKELASQKQKMLVDISHDLKTPITTIQGYAKALSDGIIPEGQEKKYFDIIYYKSVDLTELINTFYEYSKLEHPDFELSMERVEIIELLLEYIAGCYEEINDAGFNLEIDITEEKVICPIDKTQLKRAFNNVITNSLKHNPPGTTIFVGAKVCHADPLNRKPNDDRFEKHLEIIFADNGEGIPAEIAGEIFKPFVVGDESRNSKHGTGLGLSISEKIIQKHGGTIQLVPTGDDKYCTLFRILLPVDA